MVRTAREVGFPGTARWRRPMPWIAWISLALLGCASSLEQTPPTADPPDTTVDPVTELDVPYPPPEGGDPAMSLLDITYVPDGEPRRWLVFVHGGSWVGGDKGNLELAPDLVSWFLDRGYAVAAPNFRLASVPEQGHEVTYAEQCADLAAALAWLEQHREEYGVTDREVLLLGFSSGAHLVALLAADERYLLDAGLSHEILAGSISFDVHAYDVPYALELMQGSVHEDNIPLIEHLFGDTEEDQRVGSPATYAPTADVPPSLLVSAEPSTTLVGSHGQIAWEATQRYGQLLTDAGHDATWVHFEDESHSGLVMDFGTEGDGPTGAVAAFLDGRPGASPACNTGQ